MNDDGDAIRVLLGRDRHAIPDAGRVGVDVSAITPELIASLESQGFKDPGRPMSIIQLARAVAAGAIPRSPQ